MHPIALTAAAARRFLVRRQMLLPPRRLAARAESVLAVVRRLGSLQFDPLQAPGARNHELVLFARIRKYRRGWCEQFLYGEHRQLFEAMNKGLSILPMEELPHHRIGWERARERWRHLLEEQADDVRLLMAELRARGPLPTGFATRALPGKVWWGWGNTSRGRALAEGLFYSGHIGIARREGNARFYDLIERLVPPELLHAPFDAAASRHHRLLSRVRGLGLLGVGGGEVTHGIGTANERRALLDELVAAGQLLPVDVEGVRGRRYLLAVEEPLLTARATRDAEVTLLAPLDPLLWDRSLLRALWRFDYTWEVYTPLAKRRFGYYVLPILYGTELVGRIEPRMDREKGVLAIEKVWREARFVGGAEFGRALDATLEAYAEFVGASRVTWRVRPRWAR